MRTYQVFEDTNLVKSNASITEAYEHVKAGSKMISGNTTKEVVVNGKIETITEIKAHYKSPQGGTVTIIENPPNDW